MDGELVTTVRAARLLKYSHPYLRIAQHAGLWLSVHTDVQGYHALTGIAERHAQINSNYPPDFLI